METVLAIAAGGAVGSVLRHFLNNAVGSLTGAGFPWGIFIINVLGSFIMGILVAVFAHFWEPRQSIKAFMTVGILGGFTTFSTFSLDTVLLLERGALGQAAFYSVGSVAIAVGSLVAGMKIVEIFVA